MLDAMYLHMELNIWVAIQIFDYCLLVWLVI